jgi:phosphatidylserine/phosphatidylglycerophosphate/cardiolipin synthase-like enzyme
VALGLLLLVGWFAQQQGWIDAQTFGRLVEFAQEEAGIETEAPDSQPAASRPLPPPVVEEVGDGALQAFFTTPYLVYPDVPAERTPPAHEQAILSDLDAAQTSIDVATFEYNLMSIADALIRAQERGVAVRLALDKENLEKEEMEEWIERVEAAGIPVAWQDATAFLHSKYIIVDNRIVWMGSWNITENDTYRNNNNLLRITAPAIVENYEAEFSQMFDGVFGNSKESLAPNPVVEVNGIRIENYFSPKDSVASRIVERLQGAQSSIRFLAFSFTSDEIAQAMLDRHAAGVPVQGVFEARNAHGTGAEFEALEAQGLEVLEDGNCYTMHHKVIIIDEQTVITGSYNFSQRAEDTNDENLVMIDSPELARQFLDEFERVYGQAQTPTQCGG